MTRTAVTLFDTLNLAEKAITALKEAGLPPTKIHSVTDPIDLPVRGSLSSPHTEYMASLCRDLREMGATDEEANDYVRGVENGGVLVMASGTEEEVGRAVSILNEHHAKHVEDLSGLEPALPASHLNPTATRKESTLTGRIRQTGGGARMFVW